MTEPVVIFLDLTQFPGRFQSFGFLVAECLREPRPPQVGMRNRMAKIAESDGIVQYVEASLEPRRDVMRMKTPIWRKLDRISVATDLAAVRVASPRGEAETSPRPSSGWHHNCLEGEFVTRYSHTKWVMNASTLPWGSCRVIPGTVKLGRALRSLFRGSSFRIRFVSSCSEPL